MEKPSPYLQKIKDEKIKDIIDGYLRAKSMFQSYNSKFRDGEIVSFEELKEISEVLFEVKEDHHLLFKRVINPKARELEKARKFTPTEEEIELMNNIGLVFHKVMVVRELKYVMEHYKEDSIDYMETKEELERMLGRLDILFRDGLRIIKSALSLYTDNYILLAYFLENRDFVEEIFGEDLEEIIKSMLNQEGLEYAYYRIGKYYLVNGWYDRAEKMFGQALRINPGLEDARYYLETIAQKATEWDIPSP